jgi:hypothetical protein
MPGRKKLPKTRSVTTRDCFVSVIHLLTGRPSGDEGVLRAGSLARKITTTPTEAGSMTRFESSTDGGGRWHEVQTLDPPEGLFEPRPQT